MVSSPPPDLTEPTPEIVHVPAPNPAPDRVKQFLIGNPLPNAASEHQTIGKAVGLAVFASDALSSTAYATQEILIILALAGMGALTLAWPIALAITTLLAIVAISYLQTVHAYPGGGGAYIVARDNLGELPAQTAGAALLTDYILTVAVSVSAGVAQLASAFPELTPFRAWIAVAMVMLIMLINLRGVKESGITFAIPTYFFLGMLGLTIAIAFYRYLTGTLGTVVNPPHLEIEVVQSLSAFLILRAFSSGTAALTGIEAISNGITAFKQPRSHNAGVTMAVMAFLLGTIFLSMTFLAGQIGAVPAEHETIVSQLARTTYDGRGLMYLLVISATTLILIMAANTAFADFPRLAALQAGDGFLPRQFTYRGSRLVYSRGIIALAVIASLLILLFNASVTGLIPLYAIGVFLSFTLSQAGMAHRWWKVGHLKPGEEKVERGSTLRHEKGWSLKMVVNGFGAVCTFIVMMVFAVTKFTSGAWAIVILLPVLILVFFAIHHHYSDLAKQLSLENADDPNGHPLRQRVVLLAGGVHRGTLAGLAYARSLADDVTAVYVAINEADAEKVEEKWQHWGHGVPLVVLDSPYRELFGPIMTYVDQVCDTLEPDEVLTLVLPQFIPEKRWHNLLHNQTAVLLNWAMLTHPRVVVVEVPYQVH